MHLLYSFDDKGSKSKGARPNSCALSPFKLLTLNIAPPPDYSGSTEEFEVEFVIQELVSCYLNETYRDQLLALLKEKLNECSVGWIDRFVNHQGLTVLNKMLKDTHDDDEGLNIDRELLLMQCLHTIYKRCIFAQQMSDSALPGFYLKSILRCVISPCEQTRAIAGETVIRLKTKAGSRSKVLQYFTLSR